MPAEVVIFQPFAIVDHVCVLDDDEIAEIVGGKEYMGGSDQCGSGEVSRLLAQVSDFYTSAGGSSANVARSLAAGFQVNVDLAAGFQVDVDLNGSRGSDEYGAMYINSLKRAGVRMSKVRCIPGPTGRSVIFTSSKNGERTMRTSFGPAVNHNLRLDYDSDGAALKMLDNADFESASYVFLSAYAFNVGGDVLERAFRQAQQSGAKVVLNLGSFEVVKRFKTRLQELLESGCVDTCLSNETGLCVGMVNFNVAGVMQLKFSSAGLLESGYVDTCFSNEDEVTELVSNLVDTPSAQTGLDYLAQHCENSVVTMGGKVVDTTGAGDTFCSGFLYGLLRDFPLQRCVEIGSIAGAAAVQCLGAELGPKDWSWVCKQMHGDLAASLNDKSLAEVQKELLQAYALIEQIGVGVVYFGSARLSEESHYWDRSVALAKHVAKLLGVPTWTGGGQGMMRAASEGAMEAGMPVGGIKIELEAGQEKIKKTEYLPAGSWMTCRTMPTRKAALMDSGKRHSVTQRTAYIFLPGGLGTMDEMFALFTMVQLNKVGTSFQVPLIIMNYDGFYDGLIALLKRGPALPEPAASTTAARTPPGLWGAPRPTQPAWGRGHHDSGEESGMDTGRSTTRPSGTRN
eukprot:gene14500-20527_t